MLPPEISKVITNHNQQRSHDDPYRGDADCPDSRARVPFPKKTFKSNAKLLGIDRPLPVEDNRLVSQKSL